MSEEDFEQVYFEDTDDQLNALEKLAASEMMDTSEVRRIMHAMEGAAGMMGHDSLRVAIFEICKRIERSDSCEQLLTACKVLRECNQRLREGQPVTETSEELVKRVGSVS